MISIGNILGKLFGNKSERDIEAIIPVVNKIKEIYSTLQSLSNDELSQLDEIGRGVTDYLDQDPVMWNL